MAPKHTPDTFHTVERTMWPMRMVRAIGPWLLLIGYLPSLTFLGHIPLDFNIPGTSFYVGMPELAGALTHHDFVSTTLVGDAYIHIHEEHCHTNMGSCSDVPYTGSASFAMMGWVISFLGVAAVAFALMDKWWRPKGEAPIRTPAPPPRVVIFA